MSGVAPAVEPVAPARTSGLTAIFEHTRYVLGENRVTAFAFGLLIVIVFAALFGPYVVPHDPLASDTAANTIRINRPNAKAVTRFSPST